MHPLPRSARQTHRSAPGRPSRFARLLCLGATLTFLLATGVDAAEQIWAELEYPRDGQLVREPFGLVEVRGWAGTGLRGSHDVVIVIDRTASTFRPSGVDVDGDGKVGEIVQVVVAGRRRRAITDPDDTIASAELVAARRLIERLNSKSTRMGIVTFGRTERVLARIGTPPEGLLAVLDELPARPEQGGTYFYGAIIASMKVFEQASSGEGEARHRSIIFLSDGLPNEPAPPAFAEKAAVRASKHAARANIRIYSFALGTEVASRPDVFLRMARANGGELLIVEHPGEIVDYVPHVSLTKLRSVEMENLTTGESARAVRLFPDGTFDGYAPLAPGENLLRVTIHGEAGGSRSFDLSVVFEKTSSATPGGMRRLELLLEQLRLRSIETQLAEEARRKRDRLMQRQLEIEVER